MIYVNKCRGGINVEVHVGWLIACSGLPLQLLVSHLYLTIYLTFTAPVKL